MWEYAEMSRADVARLRARYDPLTDAIRELIAAAVTTAADDEVVTRATAEIGAASARLRSQPGSGTLGMSLTPEGESVSWGNLCDGLRNPLAPPLVIEHDGPDHAHIDVDLGPAYEGATGHVHGGYCALMLDHLLGDVASRGSLTTVAATGSISLRYHRPTRLGRLRVAAAIERTEGRKLYLAGHIEDADGPTITAEGVFITLRQ